MMSHAINSRRSLFVGVVIGAVLTAGASYFVNGSSDREQRIHALMAQIDELQAALKNMQQPGNARLQELHHTGSGKPGAAAPANQVAAVPVHHNDETLTPGNSSSSIQVLKDLETTSDSDPRSYADKLGELLSDRPTKEHVAIASRFIFDKANDQQGLPDYVLQSLYASQRDTDLKRVIAQVLSQRGNNLLLDNQIAETQAQLNSDEPQVRQQALNQLAKTHSTRAVDAIAPFLQDKDTNVRLEALFALRDTGNQRHINLVEALTNDPDPSVSSLASDVIGSLKNYSSTARTSFSRSDIEAELPPMANP